MILLDRAELLEGWGRLTSTSCCRKTHAKLDERDIANETPSLARDGHAVSKKGNAGYRGWRVGNPPMTHIICPPYAFGEFGG